MSEYIFTHTFKKNGGTVSVDIDLYDISGIWPEASYDRVLANWDWTKFVTVEVNDGKTIVHYMFNREEYNKLCEVAKKNLDSFDWMLGKLK